MKLVSSKKKVHQ